MIYKQQRIFKKLPSCSLSISDLDILISLCIGFHGRCLDQLKADIIGRKHVISNVDITDPVAVDNYVGINYLWVVEIFGTNGEYLNILDLTKLNQADIPRKIEKFKFGNQFFYEYLTKLYPSVYFSISIDFKQVKIFDLIPSPSDSTANDSFFEVSGVDSILVTGISTKIEEFFLKYKNYNALINKANAYDVILWLGFFPITLVYLIKYQKHIPEAVENSLVIVQLIAGILIFFVILFFFRLFFNIGRWFFPCQELVDQTSRSLKLSKYVFSLAVAGVVGTIAYNLLSWAFLKLIN